MFSYCGFLCYNSSKRWRMEISVDKPYDSLFKKVFRDIDNTRDFLKSYLPKDLAMRVDFEPMTISGTEKDDAEYNSSYLDLTVECKLDREDSKIYIIFEHKSYQESMTIVLCYESGDS